MRLLPINIERTQMRIQFIFLSALAGLVSVNAAPPTISDIRYTALTHSSLRWQFQVSSPTAYVQIKYGVVSGVYPYQSASYGLTTNYSGISQNNGLASLALGGLAPNTTYYFRMTARPNGTNNTDICETDACGSAEQVVTTPAEPAVTPATPEPPQLYQPVEPSTTGYAVVPMMVSGNGTCVAASSVSAANVTAGDGLQAIINKVGYGTIIEFPQGAACKVPPQPDSNGAGYLLPTKNVDPNAGGDVHSPNHRWIILRTASSGPADFPPFGVRTGPSWAGKMAKLIATTPHPLNGQVFDTGGTSAHHFWIQNLEVTFLNDPGIIPPDAIDPPAFVELIRITPQYSQSAPPRYVVLDRLYVHGTGFPGRIKYGASLGGTHQAMIGCYISKIDFWRMAKWTTAGPSTSNNGTVLNIPAQTIKRNINDAPIGMTAPATVTISNGTGYTGQALGILDSNGLTIQYTNGTATLNCTNCTAVKVASTGQAVNQYGWFVASIANGQFSVDFAKTTEDQTSAYAVAGAIGVQLLDGGRGPYLFDNNFIDGYGLSFYIDAGGSVYSNDDVTWVRNHQIWNQDHRPTSTNSNGFRYDVRQLWETKRGKRYLLKGNIFEGNWSYQNNGPSIFLSGRPVYSLATTSVGVSDVQIRSNIIRHASAGWTCMGSSTPPPDATTTQRVLFENNLLYDINRYVYDDNGPSFSAAYMENFPGCQDVNVRNNTMGLALGRGPYLMLIGGGAALGGRLNVTDNIMYMSFGEGGGGIGVDDNQMMPTHPRLPAVNYSGTVKQKLDSYFVKTVQTVEPNYQFTNNVIIGGMTGTNMSNLRSLTSSEMSGLESQFPAGNIFPAGNTMAEREEKVGMVSPAEAAYRLTDQSPHRAEGMRPALNGKDIGADFDQLNVDLGKVLGINLQPGATAVEVNYIAPDGRACSVDTRPAAGGEWTRKTDAGGARPRTVIVSGLNASTNYQYRILCYFEQLNDGSSLTGLGPDEVTNGTITTTALSNETVAYTVSVTAPESLPQGPAMLQYGTGPELSQQQGPVPYNANGYEFTVSWPKGTALYYRVVYLDGSNNPVGARPNPQVVLVR